jgi:plasmid stabilization system protein ParE
VILFRPAAARELAADVRYCNERYTGRGQRFAEAVERSAKVARFPYRVVYVIVEPNIDVVAVTHAKRRPGYWHDRIG